MNSKSQVSRKKSLSGTQNNFLPLLSSNQFPSNAQLTSNSQLNYNYQPNSNSLLSSNIQSTSNSQLTSKNCRRLVLEKVVGTTSSSNSNFTLNPISGELVFVAGCVVVFYDPQQDKQTKFFSSPSNKPLNCVDISENGKFLAAGEVNQSFSKP